MQTRCVTPNEAGQRLDKLLTKILNQAPKSFIYKMLRKKNITLNGKKADGSEKLSVGDQITLWLADETIDTQRSLYMFHPNFPYINKTVKNFEAKPLLQTIYDKGQQVYHTPPLQEVQAYATRSTNALWDEYRRILNPQDYPVDLSQRVWDNKMDLIKAVKSAVADREE